MITRLQQAVGRHGVVGTAKVAAAKLRHQLRGLSPSGRRKRVERRVRDRAFDRVWQVDTSGVMLPEKHDVAGPENWVHGTRYQASDPTALYDMLTGLDIDHAEYSFIDLGSGKGRAVLVAARLPFKKVIGVEYSTKLHEIGRRNLDRVPRSEQACGAIELAHADAATIEIPAGPLVIFLYNPFGEPVMRRVVDNVDRSLRNAERPVVVLYVNPRFAEPWLDAGFTADPRSTEWMAVLVRYVSPRARRSERASSRGDRARRRSDRRVGGKAGLKAGA